MRVLPGFWLMLAAALFCAPPGVAAAVLLAAAIHECGHVAALCLLRAPVEGIRLGAFGAVIHARTERLSYGRELLATLAGPTINLLCAVLFAAAARRGGWAWGYLFAGAHALLGVYNLLPIRPLDGARAFELILAYFLGPDATDAICAAVGLTCALTLAAAGAYLSVTRGGALFLLSALGLLAPQMRLFRAPRGTVERLWRQKKGYACKNT